MIGGDGDGGVVMDTQLPSGAVIGRADPALLLDVLADVAGDFELIVQMDALTEGSGGASGLDRGSGNLALPGSPV